MDDCEDGANIWRIVLTASNVDVVVVSVVEHGYYAFCLFYLPLAAAAALLFSSFSILSFSFAVSRPMVITSGMCHSGSLLSFVCWCDELVLVSLFATFYNLNRLCAMCSMRPVLWSVPLSVPSVTSRNGNPCWLVQHRSMDRKSFPCTLLSASHRSVVEALWKAC